MQRQTAISTLLVLVANARADELPPLAPPPPTEPSPPPPASEPPESAPPASTLPELGVPVIAPPAPRVAAAAKTSTPELRAETVTAQRWFIGAGPTLPLGATVELRWERGIVSITDRMAITVEADAAVTALKRAFSSTTLTTYAAPLLAAVGLRVQHGRIAVAPRAGACVVPRYESLADAQAWRFGFAFGATAGAGVSVRWSKQRQLLFAVDVHVTDVVDGAMTVGMRL